MNDNYTIPEVQAILDSHLKKAVDSFVQKLVDLRKSVHQEPGEHEAPQVGIPSHAEPGLHEQFALDRAGSGHPNNPVGSAQEPVPADAEVAAVHDPCPLCGKEDIPGMCTCLMAKSETLAKYTDPNKVKRYKERVLESKKRVGDYGVAEKVKKVSSKKVKKMDIPDAMMGNGPQIIPEGDNSGTSSNLTSSEKDATKPAPKPFDAPQDSGKTKVVKTKKSDSSLDSNVSPGAGAASSVPSDGGEQMASNEKKTEKPEPLCKLCEKASELCKCAGVVKKSEVYNDLSNEDSQVYHQKEKPEHPKGRLPLDKKPEDMPSSDVGNDEIHDEQSESSSPDKSGEHKPDVKSDVDDPTPGIPWKKSESGAMYGIVGEHRYRISKSEDRFVAYYNGQKIASVAKAEDAATMANEHASRRAVIEKAFYKSAQLDKAYVSSYSKHGPAKVAKPEVTTVEAKPEVTTPAPVKKTVGLISPPGGGPKVLASPKMPMSKKAELLNKPPKSEAQRAAMGAAASGNSTLGISKKVGKEFLDADKGGKLPEKKSESMKKIAPNMAAAMTGGQAHMHSNKLPGQHEQAARQATMAAFTPKAAPPVANKPAPVPLKATPKPAGLKGPNPSAPRPVFNAARPKPLGKNESNKSDLGDCVFCKKTEHSGNCE